MKRRDLIKTLGVAAGIGPHWQGPGGPGEPVRQGVERGSMGFAHRYDEVPGMPDVRVGHARTRTASRITRPAREATGQTATAPAPPLPTQLTVVNRYETESGTVSVKKQCMHCIEPACVSACLTKALYRTPRRAPWPGTVTSAWDAATAWSPAPSTCRSSSTTHRFPSCGSASSAIDRQEAGEAPGLRVQSALSGPSRQGRRSELLREAQQENRPGSGRHTIDHIYGEHEAGGTSALYLWPPCPLNSWASGRT
jgi:hypothetical protein